MAAKSHADSKRKYSWWWDSHISPKNSKWLQENLTDMDSKVKQMIKLIEEDADSFARRAEMYYKKRPELMKLVEEFYRAYRALAERYDHATGVIRQAHRTMAEAFPNQVPLLLADELPTLPFMEAEAQTPEMTHSSHAFPDHDELQKDAFGISLSHIHAIKRNGAFTEEPDSAKTRRGLKELNDLFMSGEGRARKALNFHDADNESNGKNEGNHDTKALSESERVTRAEAEILALKRALTKLEDEKEAGLLQYQQSLERLSNLESEVSRAQENSQGLDERASKAEAEVQTLKDSISKLQAEREAGLLQYQQCLEKVSNLEKNISSTQKDAGELNERVNRAETEAESLKKDLATSEAEKEAALVQYKQCLETISELEHRLVQAEDNAKRLNEQANKAENEIDALKLEIAKITEEKEDAAIRYQQCLEIISSLEKKLSCAEEKVLRLNSEIDDSVEKLQSSEQKCLLLETSNQNLQSELQSLVQKMGCQNEELSEKQNELGRLWNCIQEERLRFVEAETAFQTLQNLHAQSQEELRSLAAELHNKAEILENVKFHKQALEDEVQREKEENKILKEFKISSSLSAKKLQDEILNLRETIVKLEQEVELRVDERNALQQEIYCLKEELNDVNKKHDAILEEVVSTGLDLHCFGSSVNQLQHENSKLKESCEAERSEKAALHEKLEIMEKLLEKNAVLENSLSDLNVELEGVREKVKVLEETCQSLLVEKSTLTDEKATLFSQLQTTTEKLENVSEKNNLLENSLFDVNAELDGLRVKLKCLEDSCQLLDHEKSSLNSEKETLALQLNITHQMLKNIENQHSELQLRHSELKGEKESALQKVEELLVSLYAEREEHSRILQLSENQLAEKELQVLIAQENANSRKKEYEEELDRAAHAEIEIFILQKCIQDMEKKNFALLVEYQRLVEEYKMSEKQISKLKNENVENQVEMNSLSDRIKMLRIGLLQILEILDIEIEHYCDNTSEQDQIILDHIHGKLREMQNFLNTIFNESEEVAIANSVLIAFLGQLKLETEKLVTERDSLDDGLRIKSEQFLELQAEIQNVQSKNQESKETINALHTEKTDLQRTLEDLKSRYDEARVILEDQASQILNLSSDKDHQNEELRCLCEVNQKLESETRQLHKELEETKLREEKLGYQLNKGTNEIELWETQAATLFTKLQISAVNEMLFEGKVRELADACEILERGHNNKSVESEWLKERVSKLENENGRLHSHLAAYVPAVSALKDCITSLEMQTLAHTKTDKHEGSKVDSWVNHQHTEGSPQTDEDKINMAPDALSDIHDMQTKISEIEMAVKQMHESFKPKDELREIQRIGKSLTNIPVAENEVLTKDIILDQMCESSSYGRSRRGTLEADEMLELWETANKDSNSGLDEIQKVTTTGPADYHQRGATKEPKSEYTSTDSLIEKELSVDKLEISKRLTLPREEDKRKLIERLDSDARKLANLQITVQDLMKKVETTEKSTKGKGMEYDNVIGQLKAAEEAITKLFDANRKQMKNVEEGSLSFIGNPEPESDESGSISRRVSEQARRGTEKIGRLQLEVQRLQFILLKLDDERERKGKTKVTDRSPRVLLRDYLYGGTRTNQKKKKAQFCSCVKPPTKGD